MVQAGPTEKGQQGRVFEWKPNGGETKTLEGMLTD